jgi:hypothetical protein
VLAMTRRVDNGVCYNPLHNDLDAFAASSTTASPCFLASARTPWMRRMPGMPSCCWMCVQSVPMLQELQAAMPHASATLRVHKIGWRLDLEAPTHQRPLFHDDPQHHSRPCRSSRY